MSKRKAPETDVELVEAFGKLFDELEIESVEEANAVLRSAGYDPDAVAKKLVSVIDQELAASPMNWRNQRSRLASAKEKLNSVRRWRYTSKEELNAAIQELLALTPKSQPLAAHFRNFEEMQQEDMDTWLDELAYLLDTSQDTE